MNVILIRVAIVIAVLAVLVVMTMLGGCSADYMREHETPGTKDGVVTDLHKYCISNPRDSACQGPNSK